MLVFVFRSTILITTYSYSYVHDWDGFETGYFLLQCKAWKTIAPKAEEGSTASSPGGEGEEHTTRGTGNTRKLAKNAAADAMLVELGIHPKQLTEDSPDKTDDPLRRQLRDALDKLHQRQMRSSGIVPPFLGLVYNTWIHNILYGNQG